MFSVGAQHLSASPSGRGGRPLHLTTSPAPPERGSVVPVRVCYGLEKLHWEWRNSCVSDHKLPSITFNFLFMSPVAVILICCHVIITLLFFFPQR